MKKLKQELARFCRVTSDLVTAISRSMVLRESAVLSIAGAALGIVIAFGAGCWMRAILAGIGPFDPTTVGTAAFVILVTTVSGCLLPAWRAMRTDPAAIVRRE